MIGIFLLLFIFLLLIIGFEVTMYIGEKRREKIT